MKRVCLRVCCLVFLSGVVQASELFRWTDKAGKISYGDTPPLGAIGVTRINVSSAAASTGDDLPYATRIAQQNFPVTLYVGSECDTTCDQAHQLLYKRGIPFSEKALKTKEDVEAFRKLSGLGGFVPVLQVGKNFLKGFLDSEWNRELDIAGYPKTASYRQRITQPPPANTTTDEAPVGGAGETPASGVEATPPESAGQ